nr:sensor domain-containing diguanylate cyclase [Rhodovibrio sodomensis]
MDTEPEKPFDKITGLVQSVMDVPIAAVSLVDVQRQWFKSIQGLDVAETSREIAFCHHTIQQREPMIVPDATADPRFANNPLVTGAPYIRAYAGVPLKTPDGYNLGSLCAIDYEPRQFDAGQIAILTSFGKLVVDELELRQMASTDGLTGALTRRGFVEMATHEIERSRRYGRPLAVVLFDLDDFKTVNDTYGHPAGDNVLRYVTGCATDTLRSSDTLGRIGGEEFALLMPETQPEAALDCVERLRRTIADTEIPIDTGRIAVTASFGVCPLTDRYGDVESLLAAADQALYGAKTSGRNRTVFAHGPQVALPADPV